MGNLDGNGKKLERWYYQFLCMMRFLVHSSETKDEYRCSSLRPWNQPHFACLVPPCCQTMLITNMSYLLQQKTIIYRNTVENPNPLMQIIMNNNENQPPLGGCSPPFLQGGGQGFRGGLSRGDEWCEKAPPPPPPPSLPPQGG